MIAALPFFQDELDKIASSKLFRELQRGTLSSQSVQRAATAAGTSPERLTQLAQNSNHRGLRAAHRGRTPDQLQQEAVAQGINQSTPRFADKLAPFQEARELRNARTNMQNYGVSDQSIVSKARSQRTADEKQYRRVVGQGGFEGVTPVKDRNLTVYDRSMPTRDSVSMTKMVNDTPVQGVSHIGARGQNPDKVHHAATQRVLRDHELGEYQGHINRHLRGHMDHSRSFPDLNTSISNHATAQPLANEYAVSLGNRESMRALSHIRQSKGEGVQRDLFRQRGWVNPAQADKARTMSPAQDQRLTQQVRREYDARLSDPVSGQAYMDRSQRAHARMLRNTLPQTPHTNYVPADAFTTGAWPGLAG